MAEPQLKDADAIDGVEHPRDRFRLIGQSAAEAELLESYKSGRIHHAWLLSGQKGIGKATLALRMARFVLANADPRASEVIAATDLSVSPDHPVSRKISAGSHPDLLHLQRPWDEKRKRFKNDLPVDEVRRVGGMFGTTAGEGGWRVCIIDSADDMNVNAANALLKVLEEPPARALFLVISHMPGRLLPTIRSRCRKLALPSLEPEMIAEEIKVSGWADASDNATLHRLAVLSAGSLRRALLLLHSDGANIWNAFENIMHKLPDIDRTAMHALADRVAQRGNDDVFQIFKEMTRDWLSGRIHDGAAVGASAASLTAWADAWETINRNNRTAAIMNLDRKQVVIDTFRTLAEAAQNSLSRQRP